MRGPEKSEPVPAPEYLFVCAETNGHDADVEEESERGESCFIGVTRVASKIEALTKDPTLCCLETTDESEQNYKFDTYDQIF